MREIRMIELFAGIGSQIKAIKRRRLPIKGVGISEWNIKSILSYDAIHTDDGIDYSKNMTIDKILKELESFTFSNNGEDIYDISKLNENKLRKLFNANIRSSNFGSILNIEKLAKCDILTYSFPCQDISSAGKQKGIKVGTRSGLLFEVDRLLDSADIKPKVLVMENVKNLLSKKHISNFLSWCERLQQFGYKNFYKNINATNHGIPQSRDRIFMVSILNYNKEFEFPKDIILEKCIFDYINTTEEHKINQTLLPFFDNEYCEEYVSNTGIIKLFDGERQGYFKSDFTNKRIYSWNGVCPTITKSNSINIFELKGRLNGNDALRLMGFDEEDIDKLFFLTDNEKYSMAGNSIVVNVLEDLFESIYEQVFKTS